MWIKLGNEYLNLAHVARVRFLKSWKNGQDELVAELETFAPKGELQVFCRYRGAEAQELRAAFAEEKTDAPAAAPERPAVVSCHATTNTLHDVTIP